MALPLLLSLLLLMPLLLLGIAHAHTQREVEVYSEGGDLYMVGQSDIHLQPAAGRRVLVNGTDIAGEVQTLTTAVDHLRAQFQGAFGIAGCQEDRHRSLDCKDPTSRANARLLKLCSFDHIFNCCCPEVEAARALESNIIQFLPSETALHLPNLKSSAHLGLRSTQLTSVSIGSPQTIFRTDVFVVSNPRLEHLAIAGRQARRVIVQDNAVLQTLDLSGFSASATNLFILDNPITSLNLDGLTGVRRFTIQNTALTSIEFGRRRNLELRGDLRLTDNSLLESVRLLNVSHTSGSLRIGYKQRHVLNLTDIARVKPSLEFTQGLCISRLAIADLPLHLGVPLTLARFADLKTITAEGLTRLETTVIITENAQLTAVDLSSLTDISGDVQLFTNTQLVSVRFNNQVTALPNQFTIHNSPSLSSVDLSMLRNASDLRLSSNGLTSMDLPYLQEVQGTLALDNNPITALNLSSLQRVGGSMNLKGTKLSTLHLSHHLTSIGENFRCSGESLTKLHFGPSLTQVGSGVAVDDGNLEVLDLGALTHVGTSLNARQNRLRSLDLGRVQSVGKDVNLEQNALTAITFAPGSHIGNTLALEENKFDWLTFANIQSVGGDVLLGKSRNLTFLGFGSLQSVGGKVVANPMLSSVDFGNLTHVGGDVGLTGNGLSSISLGNLLTIGGDLMLDNNLLSSVNLSTVVSVAGRIDVQRNDALALVDCNHVGRCVCADIGVELSRCRTPCPAQEC